MLEMNGFAAQLEYPRDLVTEAGDSASQTRINALIGRRETSRR